MSVTIHHSQYRSDTVIQRYYSQPEAIKALAIMVEELAVWGLPLYRYGKDGKWFSFVDNSMLYIGE